MDRPAPNYPDISDLLAHKAEGRRIRARMSFVDKVKWVEAAREALAPIDRFRRARSGPSTKTAQQD